MQLETGFPSSHQLKSYVASKSRLKLVARCPVIGCWPSCWGHKRDVSQWLVPPPHMYYFTNPTNLLDARGCCWQQSTEAWSKTNCGIWQNAVSKQISKGQKM